MYEVKITNVETGFSYWHNPDVEFSTSDAMREWYRMAFMELNRPEMRATGARPC